MIHYSALREDADEKKSNPYSPMTPQEKPSSAIPGHEICSRLKALFPIAITRHIRYVLLSAANGLQK